VFVPDDEEPGFFVAEFTWSRGLEWYQSLFAPALAKGARAVGEATTSYTMAPGLAGVPERIAQTVPDARFIYLLRNPVERMRSAYVHALAAGVETRPLAEALLDDDRYLRTSSYAMQLDRYLEHFDPSRFLLVTTEDLRDQRAVTVGRVLQFLDVDPTIDPGVLTVEHNQSAQKRAPRRLFRMLGGAAIRHNVQWRGLTRLNARGQGSWWMTRPISAKETAMTPVVARQLAERLRPDVARLAPWMPASFDGWGLLEATAYDVGSRSQGSETGRTTWAGTPEAT
jgi:hypothetical protein